MHRTLTSALVLVFLVGCSDRASTKPSLPDGSAQRPLRVMLIPADGGTEQGTRADFEPVFAAITNTHGIHFDIKVGQSYNVVVEGMANNKVDVAFFGPVTYYQAKELGAAELLAVGVSKGESVYYSGIFTRRDAGLDSLADLAGKSVAFGDVNSTSSFNFPVAMLLAAGVDPVNDLGKVYLTGSHAFALSALASGQVDAACASFSSFEKAVNNGELDPEKFGPLAKSQPIPYPPLAMHVDLDPALKSKLRDAFNHVHETEGIRPEMIRGYGGAMVDRYDANFPEEEFDKAMAQLAQVTEQLQGEMLKKAGNSD